MGKYLEKNFQASLNKKSFKQILSQFLLRKTNQTIFMLSLDIYLTNDKKCFTQKNSEFTIFVA